MKTLAAYFHKFTAGDGFRANACAGRTSRNACVLVFLISCLTMAPVHISAQSLEDETQPAKDPGSAKIFVLAQSTKHSVILRWAPSTPHGWRIASRIGYKIERRTPGGNFVVISDTALAAWMPETIVSYMDKEKDNKYLGMLLNALWSDTTLIGILENNSADTSAEVMKKNTTLYAYALFGADNDTLTAQAGGLRFVDYKVKEGEKYEYRVSLDSAVSYRIDPGEIAVTVGVNDAANPPENATAEAQDRKINLRWEPAKNDKYSGYMIFRSDDKGKTYNKLISQPVVLLIPSDQSQKIIGSFTDTTIVNYVLYKYRISGVNAFGTFGEPAELQAMGRDMTPPPQPLAKNPRQVGPRDIKLTWEMENTDPDMVGFVIERSSYADSCYHLLTTKPLPVSARSYVDSNPVEEEPYYIVCSMDTAKNLGPSMPMYAVIFDSIPPAMPKGLKGTIDTTGVVRLTWQSNKEQNLLGYRVLRAHAADHEFEPLTGQVWKDTVFVDTIQVQTLTKHIYYRIAAVNKSYSPSPMSAILEMKLPALIPPEEPVFTGVIVSDTSVELTWAKSSNKDLASQVLYRRIQDSLKWNMLASLSATVTTYMDKKVEQGITYEYKIVSVDSSKLSSESSRYIQARPYDPGVRPAVQNVKAAYKSKEKSITLQWTYKSKLNENFWFVIFRSEGNKPQAEYQSVVSSTTTFVDTKISSGSTYSYAVKVVTGKGAESPLSPTVTITLP